MTPKDKAINLVQLYCDKLINNGARISKNDCVDCVVICVDEMFEVARGANDSHACNYLAEVKHELLKL